MAVKQFYHDIDLVKIGQLINSRAQNVTNAEMTALAATLGTVNKGLFVYNTDQSKNFTWDGTKFAADAVDLAGDVVFRGVITKGDQTLNPEVELVAGYQYSVSLPAGTTEALVIPGLTIFPTGASIESGDMVLLTSSTNVPGADGIVVADQAYVIQRNDEQATETVLGNVRLATQAEVTAGVDALEAITPATLAGALIANQYVKQHHSVVALAGGDVPTTVAHGLNLADSKSLLVSTFDSAGIQISLSVNVVDANTITVNSVVPLTGVSVTVAGASTTYTKGN